MTVSTDLLLAAVSPSVSLFFRPVLQQEKTTLRQMNPGRRRKGVGLMGDATLGKDNRDAPLGSPLARRQWTTEPMGIKAFVIHQPGTSCQLGCYVMLLDFFEQTTKQIVAQGRKEFRLQYWNI